MADAWHTPSAITDKCGEYIGPATNFIDGDTDTYWRHTVHDPQSNHWIIVDMAQTYTVKKVRVYHKQWMIWTEPGAIYVTDDLENLGDSVGASSANYYSDPTGWDEIDTTDKDGRFIKLVGNAPDSQMYWYEFQIYGQIAAPPAEYPALFFGANF